MVSWSSNSSWSSGCPEEYSWAAGRRRSPDEEGIHDALDNSMMDGPSQCPHVATMEAIACRQRDKVESMEVDIAHERHMVSNVEAMNEQLCEQVSSLSAYNCSVVNDLAAARSIAAQNAAAAMKYKAGFWIVTLLFIFAVIHILFYPRK